MAEKPIELLPYPLLDEQDWFKKLGLSDQLWWRTQYMRQDQNLRKFGKKDDE